MTVSTPLLECPATPFFVLVLAPPSGPAPPMPPDGTSGSTPLSTPACAPPPVSHHRLPRSNRLSTLVSRARSSSPLNLGTPQASAPPAKASSGPNGRPP
eukprot:scaffold3869_cov111-Isochrysis_galbana.AAC.5